jgi:predicted transcriptional regulator
MNPSKEELDRCEEFLTTFNQIENKLRQVLKEDERTDFSRLVNRYIDQRKSWQNDRQKLFNFANLRNTLVHQRSQPYQYPAIPTQQTLVEIERLRDRLVNPQKAIPTFGRTVETLSPEKSLACVFQKINQLDYSQFPVYEGERFIGLLTENGITRWLAHHTVTQFTTVDCEEIFIKELLLEEEARSNCSFIARDTSVDEVVEQFSDNLLLEAALITQNGKESQGLLGIATRWDILKYLQQIQ